MKCVVAVLAGLILMVSLAGCGDTIESIKEEAKIREVCEAAGGKAFYSGSNGTFQCDMSTDGLWSD